MAMLVSPVQPANALVPIVDTESGIITLVKLVQLWNAEEPIVITVLGITTLDMPLHP